MQRMRITEVGDMEINQDTIVFRASGDTKCAQTWPSKVDRRSTRRSCPGAVDGPSRAGVAAALRWSWTVHVRNEALPPLVDAPLLRCCASRARR